MQSHDECLRVITTKAPSWLQEPSTNSHVDREQLKSIIACFKAAAHAKLIPFGGELPPSSVEWDVLSECYDPGIDCSCEGLYPAPSEIDQVVAAKQLNGRSKLEKTPMARKMNGTTPPFSLGKSLHLPSPSSFCSTQMNNLHHIPVQNQERRPEKCLERRLICPKSEPRTGDPHSLTIWMTLCTINFTRHKRKPGSVSMPNTSTSCPAVQVSLIRV